MYEALEDLLGRPIKCATWEKANELPLYLRSGRQFAVIALKESRFLAVELPQDDRFSVGQLQKQLSRLTETALMPVAYSLPGVTTYQRGAMICSGIPFFSLPNQIYLPFLGMVLQNTAQPKNAPPPEKMQAATQQVFLWLFYHRGEKPTGKAELAEKLSLAKTSVTRAVAQLDALDLLEPQPTLRSPVRFKRGGVNLRKAVEHDLLNPVQKSILVARAAAPGNLLQAGETALAKYTMLNEPNIPVYACHKQAAWVAAVTPLDERWDDLSDCIRVELWKYDPQTFAQNDCVDKYPSTAR